MRTSYDQDEVQRLLAGMQQKIEAAFDPTQPLNIIGIRTRGEVLAHRLADALRKKGREVGLGVLDITLYRDDLSEIGPRPLVRPTEISIDINGKPLLLVDDVLFTGRSIRAALDALSDFGRPAAIRLAVLVDRGGRELPIQADFVGISMPEVPRDYRVNVHLREVDKVEDIQVEPRPGVHPGSDGEHAR